MSCYLDFNSYPCSGCGLCCQNISGVEQLKEFDLGNGVCKHYNIATKECSIYENRPTICKVDEMYEKVYKRDYTKLDFYKLNAEVCNRLQEINRLDSSYRIKIEGE